MKQNLSPRASEFECYYLWNVCNPDAGTSATLTLGRTGKVLSVALSPDDLAVTHAGRPSVIKPWDTAAGQLTAE